MFRSKICSFLAIAVLFFRIDAIALPGDIVGLNLGDLRAGLNTNIFSKLKEGLDKGAKSLVGDITRGANQIAANDLKTSGSGSKEIVGVNVGDLHAGLDTNLLSKLKEGFESGGKSWLDDLTRGANQIANDGKTTGSGSKEIVGVNVGDLHAGLDTNLLSKLKEGFESGGKSWLDDLTRGANQIANNGKTTGSGSTELVGVNVGDLHAGLDTNFFSKLKEGLESGGKSWVNDITRGANQIMNDPSKEIVGLDIGDLHTGVDPIFFSKLTEAIESDGMSLVNDISREAVNQITSGGTNSGSNGADFFNKLALKEGVHSNLLDKDGPLAKMGQGLKDLNDKSKNFFTKLGEDNAAFWNNVKANIQKQTAGTSTSLNGGSTGSFTLGGGYQGSGSGSGGNNAAFWDKLKTSIQQKNSGSSSSLNGGSTGSFTLGGGYQGSGSGSGGNKAAFWDKLKTSIQQKNSGTSTSLNGRSTGSFSLGGGYQGSGSGKLSIPNLSIGPGGFVIPNFSNVWKVSMNGRSTPQIDFMASSPQQSPPNLSLKGEEGSGNLENSIDMRMGSSGTGSSSLKEGPSEEESGENSLSLEVDDDSSSGEGSASNSVSSSGEESADESETLDVKGDTNSPSEEESGENSLSLELDDDSSSGEESVSADASSDKESVGDSESSDAEGDVESSEKREVSTAKCTC